MTILLAGALVAAAIVGSTLVLSRRSGRVLRLRIHKTVIVTLKSGETFRGVLFDSDSEALVLRNASFVGAKDDLSVDGEVLILRPDIATLQRP